MEMKTQMKRKKQLWDFGGNEMKEGLWVWKERAVMTSRLLGMWRGEGHAQTQKKKKVCVLSLRAATDCAQRGARAEGGEGRSEGVDDLIFSFAAERVCRGDAAGGGEGARVPQGCVSGQGHVRRGVARDQEGHRQDLCDEDGGHAQQEAE